MKCPQCGHDTLKHEHDCAHGLPGTHMAGSERFRCECGFYVGTKREALKYDLYFVLDTGDDKRY